LHPKGIDAVIVSRVEVCKLLSVGLVSDIYEAATISHANSIPEDLTDAKIRLDVNVPGDLDRVLDFGEVVEVLAAREVIEADHDY
jgi:hypothetical protein